MVAEDIIIKPIITEKSNDAVQEGKYTFQVAKNATKPQIADAVEKLLIERIPNKDTDVTLINKFCYEKIKACNGVDLSKFKPNTAKEAASSQ